MISRSLAPARSDDKLLNQQADVSQLGGRFMSQKALKAVGVEILSLANLSSSCDDEFGKQSVKIIKKQASFLPSLLLKSCTFERIVLVSYPTFLGYSVL